MVQRIHLRLVDMAIVSRRNNPVRQGIMGKDSEVYQCQEVVHLTPIVELVDGRRYVEQNHF